MGRNQGEKRTTVQLVLGVGFVVRLYGQSKNLTVETVNGDGFVSVINVIGFARDTLVKDTFYLVPPNKPDGDDDHDDHDDDD